MLPDISLVEQVGVGHVLAVPQPLHNFVDGLYADTARAFNVVAEIRRDPARMRSLALASSRAPRVNRAARGVRPGESAPKEAAEAVGRVVCSSIEQRVTGMRYLCSSGSNSIATRSCSNADRGRGAIRKHVARWPPHFEQWISVRDMP